MYFDNTGKMTYEQLRTYFNRARLALNSEQLYQDMFSKGEVHKCHVTVTDEAIESINLTLNGSPKEATEILFNMGFTTTDSIEKHLLTSWLSLTLQDFNQRPA